MNIYKEEWNTLLHTLNQFVESYKFLHNGEEPEHIMSDVNNILCQIQKADKTGEDLIVLDVEVLKDLQVSGVFDSLGGDIS